MSHIRVLICRVDDPTSDQMTELAAFDLPPTDVSALQPETALDRARSDDAGNRKCYPPSHRTSPMGPHRRRPDGPASSGFSPLKQSTVTVTSPSPSRAASAPSHSPARSVPIPNAEPRHAGQCRLASAQRHHHYPRSPGMGLSVAPGTALCLSRPPPWLAGPRRGAPLGHDDPQPRAHAWSGHAAGRTGRGRSVDSTR